MANGVGSLSSKENAMIALLHFATLVVATLLAAACAVALNWLALRLTFQLVRPARIRTTAAVRSELVLGPAQLVEAFKPHR
jgi:hypothetical protein